MADFLEEAREIVERLNAALLELESSDQDHSDTINDVFRYFHNLKGNSGIIGHKELNGLTHEAETLLNRARKGEIPITPGMVDLLLAVVDQVEALISNINQTTSVATPLDIRPLVARLKQATEEGGVPEPAQAAPAAAPEPAPEPAPTPAANAAENAAAEPAASGYDPEDVKIFESTIGQQIEHMQLALTGLATDPNSKDMIDGLYRALVTIQNSSGYMGLDDLKTQAERTAGLVDQARKSGISFDAMLDILHQECSILVDMIKAALDTLRSGKPPPPPRPPPCPRKRRPRSPPPLRRPNLNRRRRPPRRPNRSPPRRRPPNRSLHPNRCRRPNRNPRPNRPRRPSRPPRPRLPNTPVRRSRPTRASPRFQPPSGSIMRSSTT